MLHKVEKGSLDFANIYRLYYDEIEQFPLILSILEERQEGQIYCSIDFNNILIISKSGFSFGIFEDNKNDLVFDYILENEDIPNYIHFYSPSESFLKYIIKKTDKYKIRNRVQFQYVGERLEYFGNYILPVNYEIISVKSIEFDKLKIFGLDLASKFWDSKEDFQLNAIGYVILDPDKIPAAICYSACVTSKHAEMDTLVMENHRSKGFMRLVSIPFFKETNEKGIKTHWDTFEENISSFRMGAKFDPDQVNKYKLLSIFFDK